jgi:aspartate racemase
MSKEKVVGVLGGMGPFATVDFFSRIVALTPAKKDWEHLRIVIDNNVKIPSRTRAVLYGEASPVPGMIESINQLASIGADFVTLPCNSAHYFYDQVVQGIQIPWLNMLESVSKAVTVNGDRPLVLGGYITMTEELYSRYIPGAAYPSPKDSEFMWSLIEEIKLTSGLSVSSRTQLETMISKMKGEIDCVLLACTELSIVYGGITSIDGLRVIDSSTEYAKATVEFAKAQD